ncbi:hypothetical protein FDI95_gp230 [Citrobacter phage CF1 ERZ-2017]|uniref:Uncharacterized protein n=1 Tax=Citrobacter phage CF1 ERZ-2017 TaxID=2267236 RepID=A0A2H4YG48_9CAUD|nr:hypothetical protein FDI95_gp230 [Citrobacter phage CF1 ERZ-2017]AUE23103.1 hypothetical protein Cf1_00240 [Citrobacter phage CF1 ERZ-2017]
MLSRNGHQRQLIANTWLIYTDEDDIPKVAYSGSGNMFTEEEAKTASLELFTEGYKVKNVLIVKKAFEALSKIEVSFV